MENLRDLKIVDMNGRVCITPVPGYIVEVLLKFHSEPFTQNELNQVNTDFAKIAEIYKKVEDSTS